MTTCLGKICSFGLPRVPFVNCSQFMYLLNYCPNFEEVDGTYWFRVVRPSVRASVRSSRTVHARIPHGIIADARLLFFSCPIYLPLRSYAPLKKSE